MLRKSEKRIDYYSRATNKAVLFFSASSVGDTKQLLDFGIREILVSYFYMKKSLPYYDEVLDIIEKDKGIFMTDSGAFSFMGQGVTPEMRTEKYWIPYLEEYVKWLEERIGRIFVAANLDLDTIVGHDVVEKWNKKYFEPLEKKGLPIVYVAHGDETNDNAVEHFRYYCRKYKYVGVNQSQKQDAHKFYQIAKEHGARVHGFAWTELSLLRRFPFFSVDSTTWLGGVRYGTTYNYDGKNFKTIDYKKKYLRKANKIKYRDNGVDYEGVLNEDRKEINKMNLLGWLGFRKEFLKIANLKLLNKNVLAYVPNRKYKE